MPVLVSLLRGVNLGPHKRMKMEPLRALYESLGFTGVRTYLQSGNVVFNAPGRPAFPRLTARIETAIEETFGFHSDVTLRNAVDLREVVARNPFAAREGIDPAKLVVQFFTAEPGEEGTRKALALRETAAASRDGVEEIHFCGREMYAYFPAGQGQRLISWSAVETALKTGSTARNWNTVLALLEMAENG